MKYLAFFVLHAHLLDQIVCLALQGNTQLAITSTRVPVASAEAQFHWISDHAPGKKLEVDLPPKPAHTIHYDNDIINK